MLRQLSLLSLPLCLALPAPAQDVEGVTPGGVITDGSTTPDPVPGPMSVATVPIAFANAFGNSNNNIPFSWTPTGYQQVNLGTEMPQALPIIGLGLRQDNAFANYAGQTVDMEIKLGTTTYDNTNLTNTFATNATGPQTTVLNRKMVRLPNMPPTVPTDPKVFFIQIQFDVPFPWAQQPGQNILLEVQNYGNSNNNAIFTFPLDAGSGAAAGATGARMWSSAPNAATGTVGLNYSLVLCYLDKIRLTATADPYGQGCKGTGGKAGEIVPAANAAAFGNSNNNIPFSWTPTRYEQVSLGSEMPNAAPLTSLGLRQDNAFNSRVGATIDVEMRLGYTTLDNNTIGSDFAANFDSGAPTQVLNRKMVVLPNFPPTNPTDPSIFFINIAFDVPFPYAPGPNKNVLLEVVVWGNSNNNASFTYPLDAQSGTGTNATRIYASGNPSAPTGTIGRSYGLVLCFGRPGAGSAVPRLSATTRPVINTNYDLAVSLAKASSVAVMLNGNSNTNAGGIPLPFDLTAVGAPGCSLLSSFEIITVAVIDAQGNGSQSLAVPNDTSLVANHVYSQGAVFDLAANALGFAWTNGIDGVFGEQ